MTIDCVLLATPKRIEWLKKSINSINLLNFKFNKKILSIDLIDNDNIDDNILKEFEESNWIIDVVSFRNKHMSFKHAVDISESEYIFYTEDDIIINLIPENIIEVLSLEHNGRKCGVLSFNLGGSLLNYPHTFGDMGSISDKIIYKKNNIISFVRDENQRNDYFIEFPAVFFKSDLLKKLLIDPTIDNGNIERGLTHRYFMNNNHIIYFKQCMCYDKIIKTMDYLINNRNLVSIDSGIMVEECKFYELLDPNQGGIPGGFDLKKINYEK